MPTKDNSDPRLNEALRILEQTYFGAGPELVFSSPFELLVATILSAQCTDRQVNKATAHLFELYKTPEDFARLTAGELEPLVKSCGFFHTKSHNIIKAAKMIVEQYGGKVPEEREELMKLPGVGRKTANVVMSNAFGKDAIAVDVHVFRVANRIGLASSDEVYMTELQLMQNIPRKDWSKAHHWLIQHGRRICSARNMKCGACPLEVVCSYRQNTKGKGK